MSSSATPFVLFLFSSGIVAQTAPSPAKCPAIADLQIPGVPLEIASAERGPSHCRVDGIINRRNGAEGKEYGIGFALALPDNWNNDFLMQGGGGLNGSVKPPLGAQAAGDTSGLARGFAVVTTDTGHKGTGGFDRTFMADQQAVLDFDYQAVGRVAEIAKRIIAKYYGRAAAYSYYVGCSTGGREGMIMTQRYPSYFDGVVSGDPAIRTGFSNLADRWVAVSYSQIASVPGGAFSENDKKLVIDSLIKRCDARDGIEDGMIFDTMGCDFNPAQLQCAGAKSDSCLTAQQVAALQRAFSGPKNSTGVQVYPGFPFDTGINAKTGIPGLLAPGPSPVGPRTLPTEQDVDREAAAAANPLVDAVFTNLSTFIGHGGKLLFYHGASDPWFSPLDTLDYYRKMGAANGGMPSLANWSRLYMVPGMGHCSGGDAALDKFDMLTAVVDWVEKGTAPDSVIATGKSFANRSRPLCAYPKFAHYKGHGDPEEAKNFDCRE